MSSVEIAQQAGTKTKQKYNEEPAPISTFSLTFRNTRSVLLLGTSGQKNHDISTRGPGCCCMNKNNICLNGADQIMLSLLLNNRINSENNRCIPTAYQGPKREMRAIQLESANLRIASAEAEPAKNRCLIQ